MLVTGGANITDCINDQGSCSSHELQMITEFKTFWETAVQPVPFIVCCLILANKTSSRKAWNKWFVLLSTTIATLVIWATDHWVCQQMESHQFISQLCMCFYTVIQQMLFDKCKIVVSCPSNGAAEIIAWLVWWSSWKTTGVKCCSLSNDTWNC